MVMVPDAGKMHFRHSDQHNSSGGGPRPPAWASQLRCSQGRAPHDMVCPQAKNPSYAPGIYYAPYAFTNWDRPGPTDTNKSWPSMVTNLRNIYQGQMENSTMYLYLCTSIFTMNFILVIFY